MTHDFMHRLRSLSDLLRPVAPIQPEVPALRREIDTGYWQAGFGDGCRHHDAAPKDAGRLDGAGPLRTATAATGREQVPGPGARTHNNEGAQEMTETILTLTIRHDKPLPELFKDKTAAYAYDWLTARNVRTTDVSLKDWMTVEEVQA